MSVFMMGDFIGSHNITKCADSTAMNSVHIMVKFVKPGDLDLNMSW